MRAIWAIIGFCAAALAFSAAQAADEVFAVPRVPVQAQADGASAAKASAQTQGRRRAMDILLRRVTVEDDWIYLPRLATGDPAPAANAGQDESVSGAFDPYQSSAAGGPAAGARSEGSKSPIALTDRDLESLESSFEVYDERSSANSYRAYITYRFKPDALRRLLKEARIPYSETQTRTALVVPVLQTDNGVYLWEQNNPWMAAWKIRPYDNELTPMSAPLGDLEDSSTISAREALALNEEKLEALADRYSVSQVVVAHARLRQQDGNDQLSVRLVNGFRERVAPIPAEALDPSLSAFEDGDAGADAGGGLTYAQPVEVEETRAKIGDVLGQTYVTDSSGNFPLLAERAIEAAIANYAKGWKGRTLIDHSSEAVLDTTAFFSSLGDWTKIRTGLVSTPLVGSVQVYALSPKGAEMRLRVFGDPSRLEAALENYGVDFWTEGGERWFLATPSMARKMKGSRALQPERRRGGLFGSAADEPRYQPAGGGVEPYDPAPDAKVEQRY